MRVLDLGCRTGSATDAWNRSGDTVIGVDWEDWGQEILGDYTNESVWDWIEELGPYDFIWFSPDCSIFSVANMRWQRHFGFNFEPLTERAKTECEGIKYVIEKIEAHNPNLGWVMENPRSLMRKMKFTQRLNRATVTYCQYGFDRMKPTDLFGQIPYTFKPMACRNGASCHRPAPRGSRDSTQGMNKTEAGKIPLELSEAIRDAAIESEGLTFPTLEDYGIDFFA